MKTKTIDAKSIQGILPYAVGGVGGIMVSKAGISMLYKPTVPAVPTKEELTKKMLYNVALAVGGVALATISDTSTAVGKAMQGAGIVIATTNLTDAISDKISNTPTVVTKITNPTLKAALGLSCPNGSCNQQRVERSNTSVYYPQLNKPKRRGVRMPELEVYEKPVYQSVI